TMSPSEFREDTHRAKRTIEDAAGAVVHGYRAPSFSISQQALWAFEVLAELGFAYDSSIYPVTHPNYRIPTAPLDPFNLRTKNGTILEYPMPALTMGRARAPFGGGAYLRLLPYWYSRWAMNYMNLREQRPFCVYLHPWEIDPNQPRLNGNI